MTVPFRLPMAMALAALHLLPLTGEGQADPGTGSGTVGPRLRELVSEQWQVAAESVALDFGSADGAPSDSPGLRLALLGSGSGGHWVLEATRKDGTRELVRFRAGVRQHVPVAARPLPRGTVLDLADMRITDEVRWGEPGSEPEWARPGWEVQRLLREGEALRAPSVRAPYAVQSGRPVRILWERGRLGLQVQGKAAGSAPVGDEVFVRTESGQRLRGVVVAPGVVNVTQGGSGA